MKDATRCLLLRIQERENGVELLRALANPPPPRAVLVLAAVIALFSSCVERMCGVHWLTLVLIPASTTSWGRTRSWPLHFIPHPPTHTHTGPLYF